MFRRFFSGNISSADLWVEAILLAALLAACGHYYRPALEQFFSQDDFPLLATSRPGPGWVPPHLFWFMGSERAYRPLTIHFYFHLNQRLFDLDARAHHAMNLAVHLANLLLLYLLARRWLDTPAGALFAAAFYGFHAAHFYEIYWVSGISQLGVVFFTLIALLLFLKFKDTGQWRYCAAALLAGAAAFLSKEDAVIFPAVLTLLVWESDQKGNRSLYPALLSAWLLLPAYWLWRVAYLGFGLPASGVYQFGAGLAGLSHKLADYAGWLLAGAPGQAALGLVVLAVFYERAVRRLAGRPPANQPSAVSHQRSAGGSQPSADPQEQSKRQISSEENGNVKWNRVLFLALFSVLPMTPSLLIPSASEHYLNLTAGGFGILLACVIETLPRRRAALLFSVAAALFLIGFSLKTHAHLADSGWAVPVPAKAEACRDLFEQTRRVVIPRDCGVVLLYPPIEPWEKDWLMFLPKLAQDRADLNVTVFAPGESPAPRSGCQYVWEWVGGKWERVLGDR
ncbi:MAG: glycosyltransferase family 39 protein [Acidobacteria bacterium]|nr:glycosyltransferase family 39 protein [Acidobacteriota bacterium]